MLAVAGLLLALAFWPRWSLVPEWNGDMSWVLGLSWAAALGLQWGTDVVFTYGPLAYVNHPMAFAPEQIIVASIVHVIGTLSALAAAYYLCRARFGLARIPALVGAAATTAVAVYFGGLFGALVLSSVALLVSRSWVVVLAVGIGLGVLGHQKLSDALLVLGFALLCSLGAMGVRGALGLAVATVFAWLAFWVAAGQEPANALTWIRAAIDMSTGHADALSTDLLGGLWHVPIAIGLSGMVLWLAWCASQPLGQRRRFALTAATVWSLWLAWNAAFNRHDVGHVILFFQVIIIVILALILVGGRGRSLGLGLVALSFAYLFMYTIAGSFFGLMDRSPSLAAAGRTATALSSAEVRQAWTDEAARDLLQRHQITPELQAFLGDAPTLADPGDISAIWATAGPGWQPLPPLQLITSYTDAVDRLSQASLREHPRQILRVRGYGAEDGRNPPWSSPLYQLEVYCRYGVEFQTDHWQVLRPAAEDRCGEAIDPIEVSVDAGEPATVPYRQGMMTLVTVEPQPSIVDKLRSLILKPRTLHLDYGSGRWRYANGDTANRLMLNGPLPHPSYPMLPIVPYDEITLDSPTRLTFEYMPVASSGPSTGPVEMSDVIIRAASSGAEAGEAPELVHANDMIAETPEGACLLATSISEVDPFLILTVPNGAGLYVESSIPGETDIFVLELDGTYLGDQPVRFSLTGEPVEVLMPQPNPAGAWNIRIDPPNSADVQVCLISVDT